ncbi:MAG: cadherin-like domain-containing protein [Akkermansiaceae bacterium]|nr:cadherin-like domain-containing protein [Akkermansiaceae bacterium]
MRSLGFASFILVSLSIALTGLACGQSVLIPFGSTWKYLDDGSEQGYEWRQDFFDDSSWKSGLAELGYGEDETTQVGFGDNPRSKFITTYFRRKFMVDDPSALPGIKLELLRDDGAVLFVNGVEVGRSNMPEDELITKDTVASLSQGGVVETVIHEFIVSPLLLKPGENIIAVEVHQDKPGSSDLSFDLRATDVVGPTAPVIQRNWLAASSGESIIAITPEQLRASDFTSEDDKLSFRISGLESGRFELVSAPGIAITDFTQNQITGGEIQFVYEPGRFGAGLVAGNLLEPTRLSEISGLVASIQNPEILWAHQDSDKPANLIALGTNGRNRGEWILAGATNKDWEDIGAATVNDEPLLYIGDFGDNGAARADLNILRIREPLLVANGGGIIPETDIERIEFQYPATPGGEGGPGVPGVPARRDAESMIVDPHSGDVYILSKRETVGRLFRLAHQENYIGVQTLEYLGEMPAIIHDRLYGFSVSTTAADISRDGLEIIVRNYEHVLYFRRPDLSVSIADLLTGSTIEELPFFGARVPGGEPKGEAVCFSSSADAYFTIGERVSGAPEISMFRYRRLAPDSPPKFAITVSDGILDEGPRPAKILFNAEPMEIWRHHHFSIEELADPNLESSLWGDLADGDGDGRRTLIEYALDTNPRSTIIEDDGVTIGNEGGAMVLTYRKIHDRTDIIYQVQASSDLKTWVDSPDELFEALPEGEIRRVSIPLASGEGNFLRLKVSR